MDAISEIIEIDMQQLCRTCGNTELTLIPIDEDLLQKVNKYLPIHIQKDDILPTQLCANCETAISLWHNFIVECSLQNQRFLEMIEESVEQEQADIINDNDYIPPNEDDEDVPENEDDADLAEENDVEYLEAEDEDLGHETGEMILGDVDDDDEIEKEDADRKIVEGYIKMEATDNLSFLEEPNNLYMSDKTEELITKLEHLENMMCSFGCEVGFSSKIEYEKHLMEHLRKCLQCESETFSSTTKCGEHIAEQHLLDQNTLTCKYCAWNSANNPEEMQVHIDHHNLHKLATYCKQCDAVFNTTTEFIVHERNCKKLKAKPLTELKCVHCDKVFKREIYLRVHYKEFHSDQAKSSGDTDHICPMCNQGFRRKFNMQKHIVSHSVDNCCKICCLSFTTKTFLQKHIGSDHNKTDIANYEKFKTEVKCDFDECSLLFKSKFELYYHIEQYHLGAEIVTCPICKKIFKSQQQMENHSKIHSNVFQCDNCSKNFGSEHHLKQHMVVHTNAKPFVCDICGDRFRYMSNLYQHKQAHRQSRQYNCHYCDQKFVRPNTFRDHMRIHMNINPYKCEFCEKSYSQSSILSKHIMKIHRKCEICGQMIGDKMKMQVHKWKNHPKMT